MQYVKATHSLAWSTSLKNYHFCHTSLELE